MGICLQGGLKEVGGQTGPSPPGVLELTAMRGIEGKGRARDSERTIPH